MAEVKFKVRYNALILREFTVADMARATGLNVQSIRTELQRMRREGLIISSPHTPRRTTRGGRPSMYRIADELEKRLQLVNSIEVYSTPEQRSGSRDKPSSRTYLAAKSAIDDALNAHGQIPEKRADTIRADLDAAEEAEGNTLAPETVKAYLKFERARLAYVRGRYEQARNILSTVRDVFATAQSDLMVALIDEYDLCARICMDSSKALAYGGEDESHRLDGILEYMQQSNFRTTNPLTLLLVGLVRKLPARALPELWRSAYRAVSKLPDPEQDARFYQVSVHHTIVFNSFIHETPIIGSDLSMTGKLIEKDEKKERIPIETALPGFTSRKRSDT